MYHLLPKAPPHATTTVLMVCVCLHSSSQHLVSPASTLQPLPNQSRKSLTALVQLNQVKSKWASQNERQAGRSLENWQAGLLLQLQN
jgi:hypothetical protein